MLESHTNWKKIIFSLLSDSKIKLFSGEFEMSKLQSAMNSYHLYEGTQKGRELDEAWLKKTQEEHEKKDPSYK